MCKGGKKAREGEGEGEKESASFQCSSIYVSFPAHLFPVEISYGQAERWTVGFSARSRWKGMSNKATHSHLWRECTTTNLTKQLFQPSPIVLIPNICQQMHYLAVIAASAGVQGPSGWVNWSYPRGPRFHVCGPTNPGSKWGHGRWRTGCPSHIYPNRHMRLTNL